LLAGCGQNGPPSLQPPPANFAGAQPGQAVLGAPQPATTPPAPIPTAVDSTGQPLALPPAPPIADEPTPQEKHEAAPADALGLRADGKLTDALAAREAGGAAQDTEQIRLEIDKLKLRIERRAAADRTVQDIQTVLSEGKPDEAARLAGS